MKYVILTISFMTLFLAQSSSEKPESSMGKQRNLDRRAHIFSEAQKITRGQKNSCYIISYSIF